MNRSPESSLSSMLHAERALLDKIFREGGYEIEAIDENSATVRSSDLICTFEIDPARQNLLSNEISMHAHAGEWKDDATTWLIFLGEEAPPISHDKNGRVNDSREVQLRTALETLFNLSQRVFSDPLIVRDAIQFLRGYRQAYNDYYEGKLD